MGQPILLQRFIPGKAHGLGLGREGGGEAAQDFSWTGVATEHAAARILAFPRHRLAPPAARPAFASQPSSSLTGLKG